MQAELLLPDITCLRLDSWAIDNGILILSVSTTERVVACPYCNVPSDRVHSYYRRKPADLPCASYPMCVDLCVRRFYCRNRACSHTTFTERIPSVVAPYARRTARLAEDQTHIAYAVGGEEGARLSTLLRMPISPDTLLRLIRGAPEPVTHNPKVLGVDDWAFRKGHNYGTILVDLESHEPVELLPDRTAESLALWLQEHPGVEIISRDRGKEYIKGATLGAPDAVQVADRWHLLKNLREAIERFLEKKSACLRAAVQSSPQADEEIQAVPAPPPESGTVPKLTWAEEDKQARRHRRQARYDRVNNLHEQGLSNRAIARQAGMCVHTVAKYINADSCPFYPEGSQRKSKLDPYMDYLHEQWQAGRRNATQLWHEIRQQGFSGSRGLVARWAASERKLLPNYATAKALSKSKSVQTLTPGQATWLFVKSEDTLTPDEQAALRRMADLDDQVAQIHNLTQIFVRMVKERQPTVLGVWLKSVTESGITALTRFADGLCNDLAAVRAALELPWSNGQVEGQAGALRARLKFIKRSMYGRANFDLLRKRVLGFAYVSPA